MKVSFQIVTWGVARSVRLSIYEDATSHYYIQTRAPAEGLLPHCESLTDNAHLYSKELSDFFLRNN